jgi:hypothetical protein
VERNEERDKSYQLQIRIAKLEYEKEVKEADSQGLCREKERYSNEILKLKIIVEKQQVQYAIERDNARKARVQMLEFQKKKETPKPAVAPGVPNDKDNF